MSTGTIQTAPSQRGGGRAFGPGSRWLLLAAAVIAVVLGGGLALALSHHSSIGSDYVYTQGQIPKWIPNTGAPANPAMITATRQKPATTMVEGDTVHAIFPSGMAVVNVSGPTEPDAVVTKLQDGKWKNGENSPGTMTVTFTDVQGTVPLKSGSFYIMDQGSPNIYPAVKVAGGGKLPRAIHTGERLTLKLSAKAIPQGQGVLVWVPWPKTIIAGWEFDFELT